LEELFIISENGSNANQNPVSQSEVSPRSVQVIKRLKLLSKLQSRHKVPGKEKLNSRKKKLERYCIHKPDSYFLSTDSFQGANDDFC